MKTLELMEKWQELYKEKNHDYGSSWTKTGKILDILFDGKEIKVESIKDYNVLAIIIRVLDKLCRFTNLYFLKENKPKVDESLVETSADAGTYWFMLGELVSEIDENSLEVTVAAEEEHKRRFQKTTAKEIIEVSEY